MQSLVSLTHEYGVKQSHGVNRAGAGKDKRKL